MPRPLLAPVLTALCALTGSLWEAPAPVPPEEKAARTAEALRELRKPVHEWIGRDIGGTTLAENRAYADLILAFGLARAGDADEAKKLLRDAAAVLGKGDEAHKCLLSLYRHRIEQVLAGKPPVGTLPAKLLAPVAPTGKEGPNAPIKMHHYVVLRARELSRVIEPLEQVDPYLPWTSRGTDDPPFGRLGPLQDEQDPERFAVDARKLLKDTGDAPLGTRLQVVTRLAGLAPRAGDTFCAELLEGVPELLRGGRKADGEQVRAGTVALAEQSLALAAGLRKPELFKPLVAEAVELIKTADGDTAPGTVARLTVRCERGFRVMALRDEAAAFLKDTAGKLPAGAEAGKTWADAARTRLAEAGVRRVAGQGAEADKIRSSVRGLVLDPPAGDRGISYYRLVAEYVAACGWLAPADAEKALGELLTKLGRVPDTWTTATHFSRYHLMILEAAVLDLACGEF